MNYVVIDEWIDRSAPGRGKVMLKTSDGQVKSLAAWLRVVKRSRTEVYQLFLRHKDKLPSDRILRDDTRPRKRDIIKYIWHGQKSGTDPVLTKKVIMKNDYGRDEDLFLADNGFCYDCAALAKAAKVKKSCMATRLNNNDWDNPDILVKGVQLGKKLNGKPRNKGKRVADGAGRGTAEYKALSDKESSCGRLWGNGTLEDMWFPLPDAGRGSAQRYISDERG